MKDQSRYDRPGASTALGVQVHGGHPQADEAGEEGLLHVGVLLEGHVLDDGGQLVVVPDHDPPLQPAVAVRWVLREVQWYSESIQCMYGHIQCENPEGLNYFIATHQKQ